VGVVVEEGVAGEVRWVSGILVVQGGVHGPYEVVHGEQVHPAAADDGRRADGVEDPLQAGLRCPTLGGAAAGPHAGTGAVGGVSKVEQVGPFGVVELQGAGDRIEDGGRDAGEGAAFEFGVVLDADPREGGDLTAAQPGHGGDYPPQETLPPAE
jgi:hypothetical protein